MKKINFIVILITLLALSCKKDKKEIEEPTQMEQVMAIHDEVMPKMSVIGKLVGELNDKVDSTEIGLKYEAAKRDLQASHKTMMDWMQGFGDRFNSDEILNGKELTAEKQEWLSEEEEKVKALKEQINKSIEQAEALLKKE
ncbi:outer membrane translocation and assembly module TamA [Saonia flava]|uniref:Outer membrane translocation and assembly module TamA n=1 Tax=Saonia flava TaxID=523696 RepID=A0A846R2Z2_9FLAO|nr:hypothetical protein [Saonia flava]NJB71189.1 outer membrane translocation and assembly module TamA [Saonia flava]